MDKDSNKKIKFSPDEKPCTSDEKPWTPDQERAINDDGNILVSASAGSGKTTVMIERIMRLLSNGVPISRILVLVFNNSTGLELKQKITQKLIERMTLDSEKKRPFYRTCLDELPFASIGTIDSFCLSLVKENFEILNTTPNAEIADDAELKAYHDLATKAMLEHYGKSNDEMFDRLISIFGTGRNEEGLISIILKLHNLKSIQQDGDEFLREMGKAFDDFESGHFTRLILENQKNVASKFASFVFDLECKLRPDGQIGKADVLAQISGVLFRIANCGTLQELSDIFAKYEPIGNLPPIKGGQDKELSDMARTVKNKFGDIMKDGQDNLSDYDYLNSAHIQNREFFLKIVQAVGVFEQKLREIMQKDEKFSFNDIELLAVKLLSSEHSEKIRAQFDYVFVDEYQDINPIQEFLIESFMASNNTFMVGDTKQSIYGFRMADPNIFLGREQRYAESGDGVNIKLNRNFRSTDEILGFVNSVFNVIMTKENCGIDYKATAKFEIRHEKESQNQSAVKRLGELDTTAVDPSTVATDLEDDPSTTVATDLDATVHDPNTYAPDKKLFSNVSVHLFEKSKNPKREIKGDVYKLMEHKDFDEAEKAEIDEGRFIARTIKAIVGKEQHPTKKRKYDYGDVAILFRSNSAGLKRIIKTLIESGIPLDNSDSEKNELPQRELVILLKVLDNPKSDIDLAGFLLSYFGGLSESDLATIRIAYPDIPLFSACVSFASEFENCESTAFEVEFEDGNNMVASDIEVKDGGSAEELLAETKEIAEKAQLAKRLKEKLRFVEEYRLKSSYKSVSELLESVLFDTAYDAYLLAKGGGELAGVMEFLSSLAGRDYNESVHKFLKAYSFIKDAKKSNSDGASHHMKVALKTIHKSKGLEYPIVFLINIDNPFSRKSIDGDLLVNVDGEVGIMCFDEDKRIKGKTVSHMATALAIKQRELREEMRLFYVALTRAQHRLYLTGKCNKNYNEFSLSEPNSYLQFLNQAVRAGSLDESVIKVVPSDNALQTKVSREIPIFTTPEQEYLDEIQKQFEYNYPHQSATKVAQKFSVTAISNEQEYGGDYSVEMFSDTDVLDTQGKVLSREKAIQKGVAYHKVMETIDFELDSVEKINEHIRSLVEIGELDENLAELVDENEILCCLNSDVIKLASKSFSEREKAFMMLVPLCDVSDDENNKNVKDKVLVQGVIDLLIFSENAGEKVVIVDFKNSSKGEAELRKSYEKQLNLYKMAVQSAYSVKVDKVALYSFTTRKTIYF